MFDSKLVKLFMSFSKEEKKSLQKWLKINTVNKNKHIYTFLNFLLSRKKITKTTVSKARAHAYVYPGRSYNDMNIRHLIWKSIQLVEQFLVHNNIEHNPVLKEQILSAYYKKKDFPRYAIQEVESGIDVLNAGVLRNTTYYNRLFEFYTDFFDISSGNVRTDDFSIGQVVNSFTLLSIMETLKTSSRIIAIQKVGDTRAGHYLLPVVLELIKLPEFNSLPQVRIYFNIYQVAANEDEQAFQRFVEDIKAHEDLFLVRDLNELYRMAINYCIKRSNQNSLLHTRQAFDLYLYGVRRKILLVNNEISRFIFTNIVTLGVKLNEFQAVEYFINNYSKWINIDYRKNTIDFNKAKLLYARREFDKALNILLTNTFQDIIWNLNAKYLLLKIYFDQRNIQALGSHLKAFRIYIRRKSGIGYHKTYFENVIRTFSKLLRIYKNVGSYEAFSFPDDTPDIAWFDDALKSLRGSYAPKNI